mgnify:CR=1 FL=1
MPSAPHITVIGGGSTGTGIARDLAMRGLDVTLLEQGNLTHGTTGRMHGLLHSGGRYAVADQASATACIKESRVIREIAGHCVEMTGGLFVKRPEDPAAYFQRKLRACESCDIPVEVISGSEARTREPHLASDIEKAIAVPDGAVDPFRLVVANAASARDHGARIETHSTVTDLLVEGDEVVGVEVDHAANAGGHGTDGGTETIQTDYVVNATGAWAGQIGALAGVDIEVRPSKGAMVVTNARQVDTVINRCRPKGDADIIVPHETTAILGTTDEEVDDPDAYAETKQEVDALIDELAKLVPMLADARTLRSFWGVRPLYEPPDVGSDDPSEITREFFLLDHAERDGIGGLASIVGGKFTTHRLMSEVVSDHVCDHFGIEADCQTATTPLPGSEDFAVLRAYMDEFGLRSPIGRRSVERLGSRADEVLKTDRPNPTVCDCEAVTRAEIQDAIGQSGADLNAVRIRTRASMGNCQGGLCAHRLAGELHGEYEEAVVRDAWDELVEERWTGQKHALWGEQLSQAMLNYALQAATQNRDSDPAEGQAVAFDAFDSGPGATGGHGEGGNDGD